MTTHSSEQSPVTIDVGGDRHDELFDVLSNARRRFVLHALQRADRKLSLSELTSDLVSWEANMTDPNKIDDVRGDVEVSLVHTHLPKLDDAGLVDYDREAEQVWFTDHDHELASLRHVVEPVIGGDD